MQRLVLVVEDEPGLAALLRHNLEREGFAVNEARDGEAALLHLCARKPDVVLLDWTLPGTTGLDLCHPDTPWPRLARFARNHANGGRRRGRLR
jgi:two-component system, OmpR family, phosphate regulon response regulator PhoB